MTFTFSVGKDCEFSLTDEQWAQMKSHGDLVDHYFKIAVINAVKDANARAVRKDFKTEEDWLAESKRLSELKLGAMMNGEFRVGKVRAPVDPIAKWMKRAAAAMINVNAAAKVKIAGLKGDALAEKIDSYVKVNEAAVIVRATAMRDEEIARRKREDEENAAIEGIDLDF